MDLSGSVAIRDEILRNLLCIFQSGLHQVENSCSVYLLSMVVDIEIERDVVIPEILHLELRGNDFASVSVED